MHFQPLLHGNQRFAAGQAKAEMIQFPAAGNTIGHERQDQRRLVDLELRIVACPLGRRGIEQEFEKGHAARQIVDVQRKMKTHHVGRGIRMAAGEALSTSDAPYQDFKLFGVRVPRPTMPTEQGPAPDRASESKRRVLPYAAYFSFSHWWNCR